MGFYSNVRHITPNNFFFFSIFFPFCSVLLSFFSQSLPLIFCSVYPIAASLFLTALPCQSNSTLAPCWIGKPLIQRFAVLSWQAGSQSFRLVSNPMHYFKSDGAFLPESFHQHNVSLFSHLIIRFLCMSYCIPRPQHAVLKCLGNGLHLLQGEESLCPSLLYPLMWDCFSVIRTQLVQEEWYFSFV